MNLRSGFQTALSAVYPPHCIGCGEIVISDFGLCGSCWGQTPFVGGAVCDQCGIPVPGDMAVDERIICDECIATPRPWQRGRAALLYRDQARALVLALKHGDRQDVFRPAARWLARSAQPILEDNRTIVVPIPLHWMRLAKRRYNQSALLAKAFGRETGLEMIPDVLIRPSRTPSLDGKTKAARFQQMAGAITVHPRRRRRIIGRPVLLLDDVMTSGATLAAAAQACLDAGADHVNVLVLARVTKDA